MSKSQKPHQCLDTPNLLGPLSDTTPHTPAVEWVERTSQSLSDSSHLQSAIFRTSKLVFLICLE